VISCGDDIYQGGDGGDMRRGKLLDSSDVALIPSSHSVSNSIIKEGMKVGLRNSHAHDE
jgi:hypothetical protein